jgi:hypothetical protein
VSSPPEYGTVAALYAVKSGAAWISVKEDGSFTVAPNPSARVREGSISVRFESDDASWAPQTLSVSVVQDAAEEPSGGNPDSVDTKPGKTDPGTSAKPWKAQVPHYTATSLRPGGRAVATVANAPAGSTTAYQWLRDGKPIKGAVKAKYAFTKRDVGHRISVRAVTTLSNGSTASKVSVARTIHAKRAAAKVSGVKVSVSGSKARVAFKASNLAKGQKIVVRWTVDGKTVKLSGSKAIVLKDSYRGKTIKAVVRVFAKGAAAGTAKISRGVKA